MVMSFDINKIYVSSKIGERLIGLTGQNWITVLSKIVHLYNRFGFKSANAIPSKL